MLRAALVVFWFGWASAATIPVVGCPSDGQVGPVDAPPGGTTDVSVKDAARLAYYRSAQDLGVLGPRGWHCFGTYGSGGSSLFVSPDPIGNPPGKFTGAAIQASFRFGDTSGRFFVAEVIARVFPAFQAFAERYGFTPAIVALFERDVK